MAKRDYYEVLGINKGATDDEIKKAYRKVAMANHPDTHPNDKDAEERFKEASEAYEVLSDPKKKAAYDQYGFAGVDGMGGAGSGYQNVYRDFSDIFGGSGGFSDIFSSFFGGGGSQRRNSNSPQQGQSLRYDLTIDFKEATILLKGLYRKKEQLWDSLNDLSQGIILRRKGRYSPPQTLLQSLFLPWRSSSSPL